MKLEFLQSLVVIFGMSALVVYALGRLRIPSIIGFLVAGVIMGPYGLELVRDIHLVEVLAEIGVVLLMFTIGLEFSLKNLMMLRSAVFGGGMLQVALTCSIVTPAAMVLLAQEVRPSIFDGFLVALSSTAIAIKLLMDRGEINSPHGRSSVAILIFQDLCVVPFVLFVPILAGTGGSAADVVVTLAKAAVVIAAVLLTSRWGVPQLLHQVVRTRSRELFVITIILLCIGTAFLTAELGLSLALGAFLAGIIISESEYASQAISDVLPFKESFTGLFFISIGMLMDLRFLLQNLPMVLSVVGLIVAVKIATVAVSALAIGQSVRTALQTAFYLFQIGEFSFVLAGAGRSAGLIQEEYYQTFLSASIITMLMTPLLVALSRTSSDWVASWRLVRRFDSSRRGRERESYPQKKKDHVIIVGFGVNGRNLARVLRESDIPYAILELNSNTVRKMKKKGEPVYYGDGTSAEILHKLRVKHAKMLVVAISDAAATRRTVQIARQENPSLYILVRTRYVTETDDLKALGANEVIPEEFETSVEIFSRVLHHYHVPRNVIREHVDLIRSDSYRMLRTIPLPRKHLHERYDLLKGLETETFLVKDHSPAQGHSLEQIRLRSETGATIMAVRRGDEVHENPQPSFVLAAGDIILLVGTREKIEKAVEYLDSPNLLTERYYR